MSECPYKGDSSSAEFLKPNSAETLKNAPQSSKTNLPDASILQSNTSSTAEVLPTDREKSTIPRHDAQGSTWLYPSPRMFYNALLRKGHETRPEDVQVMVDVHNFLNEQVWQEILKWESHHKSICGDVKLKRFMGRPQDLSPRARLFNLFFGTPKPFDRHDWTVDRCGQEVRYVIDYYSGPKGQENVFYCDVRPALDSWQSFIDRSRAFWRERFSSK